MNYGWYHVSWAITPESNRITRQYNDLIRAANAGCNLMAVSHLQNVDATIRLLNTAHTRKMKLIIEDIHPTELHHFKDHPAFLATTIADDANAKPLHVVQAMSQATPSAKYISIGPGYSDSCSAYYPLANYVGVQTYTFPYESVGVTFDMLSGARENGLKAGVGVIANLQCHTIGGGVPSPSYIRSQVWAAKFAGMTTILGYALLAPEGIASSTVFNAFNNSNKEVATITQGITAPVKRSGNFLVAEYPSHIVKLDTARNTTIVQRK